MRAAVLIAVAVVYSVAAFPAAIAPELPGSPDPAVMTVPFSAAFALAFVPLGRLADRLGWSLLLLGALAGVAVGGVALALTSSPEAAAGARALQGVAAAGLPPAAQALLAQAGGTGRAGRAISSMMAAVAVGTLGGPLVAGAAADAVSWRAIAVGLGAILPAATAAVVSATVPRLAPAAPASVSLRDANRPLLAACAVAALVLAGYWTLLTRLETIVDEYASGSAARLLAAVAGVVGIGLVVAAGRAVDRSGPRRPMIRILGLGAFAAAVAASVDHGAAVILGTGMVLALYWSYLPVVSVQVVRSAPESVRATALGLLYSSMWLGAAIGGGAAAALPDAHAVVAGVAVAWLLAMLVAAAGFHRSPVVAA
jgi:YNFM family putative membrane transporter